MLQNEYDICIIGASSILAKALIKYLRNNHSNLSLLLVTSKEKSHIGFDSHNVNYTNFELPNVLIRQIVYDFTLLQNKRVYDKIQKIIAPSGIFVHISTNALLHKFNVAFKGDTYIRLKKLDRNLVKKTITSRMVILYIPNIYGNSDLTWQKFLNQTQSVKKMHFGKTPKLNGKFMKLNNLTEYLDPSFICKVSGERTVLELAPFCNTALEEVQSKILISDKKYLFYKDQKKDFVMMFLTSFIVPHFLLKILEKFARSRNSSKELISTNYIVEGMTHAYLTSPIIIKNNITLIDSQYVMSIKAKHIN